MNLLDSTSHCKSITLSRDRSLISIHAGRLVVVDEYGNPTGKGQQVQNVLLQCAHTSPERRIFSDRQIIIGRDRNQCHWTFDDPYMSQKHLRIYTVITEDDDGELDPLVYAEDLCRNGVYWNNSLMGKDNDAFLLCHGDSLRLSSRTRLVYQQPSSAQDTDHFDVVQEKEMERFCNHYVLTDRLLGSGTFGRVFMAIEQTTRNQLACKVVDLRRIGPAEDHGHNSNDTRKTTTNRADDVCRSVRVWADKQKRQISVEGKLKTYIREVDILSSLSHPNIIALDKVFITDNNLYIFQSLLTAGDLFSYVHSKNNMLTEVEAAVVGRQVLVAVQFLHERNIAHRDLGPGNILLTSASTDVRVVLSGFGSSRKVLSTRRATSSRGTEDYDSSEINNHSSELLRRVLSRGSLFAADIWSVGVISALLLVGLQSSDYDDGSNRASKVAMIAYLSQLEDLPRWMALGQRPKDFVRRLLVLEEQERSTAKAAVEHPWFLDDIHKTNFDGFYQQTIEHWRPRIPNVPIIEFVEGECKDTQLFDCSRRILEAQEERPRKRSSNVPVDSPYKPFYRKVYNQSGIWPKRRRGRIMSEEAEQAIEQWKTTTPPLGSSATMARTPTTEKQLKMLDMPNTQASKAASGQSIASHPLPTPGWTSRKSEPLTPLQNPRARRRTSPSASRAVASPPDTGHEFPIRPSLSRSHSFQGSMPFSITTSTLAKDDTHELRLVDEEPRLSRLSPHDPAKGVTPNSSRGWPLDPPYKTNLRIRSSSASRKGATPSGGRIRSVFDIDNADNGIEQENVLQTPRRARDSVLLAAMGESMVDPHNAHVRVSVDEIV